MRTAIPRDFGFDSCFACGPANPRGLHLAFEREDDAVVATFTPAHEHGGYGALLHGGMTATLLDEAMAWAVYGVLGRLAVTTELHIRLSGALHCGTDLTVRGWIASHDDAVAQAAAEVRAARGAVAATCTGTMRFLSEGAARRLALGRPRL